MNYYQSPFFPQQMGYSQYPQQIGYPPLPQIPIPEQNPYNEQSYIENILRLNIGKVASVYMNFENSQWGSKIFKGIILGAGRDHLILKDSASETRFVLLLVYLDYVTFDEPIEYSYPYRRKDK